jgi:hypothetical protein
MSVLRSYASSPVTMLTFLMKSRKAETLRIKLSAKQDERVRELKCALRKKDVPDLELLHKIIFSFSDPPDRDAPIAASRDPIWCYIAISSLCIDGSTDSVQKMTGKFTIWEYIIRSSAMFEITKDPTLTVHQMER